MPAGPLLLFGAKVAKPEAQVTAPRAASPCAGCLYEALGAPLITANWLWRVG